MVRSKKNGTYINECIEKIIYERWVKLCIDAGQSKITATERAVTAYFNNYVEKQRVLKALKNKK